MATVTKPIILNETYREKMDDLVAVLAGVSKGALPVVSFTKTSGAAVIAPNVKNVFPKLTGGLTVTFDPIETGLDNEWVFVIQMGGTAQSVTLPEIEWYLGIAPTFETNSLTEVRVHRVGDAYKGVWIA